MKKVGELAKEWLEIIKENAKTGTDNKIKATKNEPNKKT